MPVERAGRRAIELAERQPCGSQAVTRQLLVFLVIAGGYDGAVLGDSGGQISPGPQARGLLVVVPLIERLEGGLAALRLELTSCMQDDGLLAGACDRLRTRSTSSSIRPAPRLRSNGG